MRLRLYALVMSLAAAGLGVALWRELAAAGELAARNTRLVRQIADLRYEAKQATAQAEELGMKAVELDSQLGSAKSRTTATESRQFQLTRELTETKSRLTEREQREVALMAELETLRQQVAGAAAPATRPATEPEPEPDPALAAPFQVVRVGPRDAFVVVDYGAGQGARPGQVISLWRGTSEVARVQISEARPRFSLAQVLSATLKGQLQPGDLVLLTN